MFICRVVVFLFVLCREFQRKYKHTLSLLQCVCVCLDCLILICCRSGCILNTPVKVNPSLLCLHSNVKKTRQQSGGGEGAWTKEPCGLRLTSPPLSLLFSPTLLPPSNIATVLHLLVWLPANNRTESITANLCASPCCCCFCTAPNTSRYAALAAGLAWCAFE